MTTTKKLKWLLVLVLIFGGFAVYKFFGVLATDLSLKEYTWLFKIVSEFGLFLSVIISVGYVHHWLIAEEEHRESEKNLRATLETYVNNVLFNSVKRGFLGITNKEFDFSQIMSGLKPGDYVYWMITFDPRFKNKSRELENAIKNGVHFRLMILKAGSRIGELRATEAAGFNPHEFNEYSKLFKVSLEDVIGRIDDSIKGSIGVFIYDGLPCIPFFIIIRNESKKVSVYNSFYLTEPVSKMPYLNWETVLKLGNQSAFESDDWNLADLFFDYFKTRWEIEKSRLDTDDRAGQNESDDFICAPASAKKLCSTLYNE
ncbi:hypothetical protein [Methylomicrobium sp. Wu6]|uniref:hypothetical protein n=1 Tax=Methylomicrobium sp. Wu6 TaxID=3107928 RepID=UPI002DD64ED5|nr:hypothetical protein [Methylomicrobium sp. Wu6]MEC4749616.1 hypothetical protein [Methylomicrobium sp. Wu6]